MIRWVEESGPEHRWHFGMMATYGLRPHEIELSSMLQGGELQVWDETPVTSLNVSARSVGELQTLGDLMLDR